MSVSPVLVARITAHSFGRQGNKSNRNPNDILVRGPGIFISCPRSKESRAVGEAYDLFNDVARHLLRYAWSLHR
jgi:hypothetical protein